MSFWDWEKNRLVGKELREPILNDFFFFKHWNRLSKTNTAKSYGLVLSLLEGKIRLSSFSNIFLKQWNAVKWSICNISNKKVIQLKKCFLRLFLMNQQRSMDWYSLLSLNSIVFCLLTQYQEYFHSYRLQFNSSYYSLRFSLAKLIHTLERRVIRNLF